MQAAIGPAVASGECLPTLMVANRSDQPERLVAALVKPSSSAAAVSSCRRSLERPVTWTCRYAKVAIIQKLLREVASARAAWLLVVDADTIAVDMTFVPPLHWYPPCLRGPPRWFLPRFEVFIGTWWHTQTRNTAVGTMLTRLRGVDKLGHRVPHPGSCCHRVGDTESTASGHFSFCRLQVP